MSSSGIWPRDTDRAIILQEEEKEALLSVPNNQTRDTEKKSKTAIWFKYYQTTKMHLSY
jgi:hypothetical protein